MFSVVFLTACSVPHTYDEIKAMVEKQIEKDKAPSGSLEDLEIIQEEDMHPSIDTSLNHEEDDLEIDEPQSHIVPICKSTRTRRAPDRMCLYINTGEHELGDLGKPANYKAALLDPKSEKWLNAMILDLNNLSLNDLWSSFNLHIIGDRGYGKDITVEVAMILTNVLVFTPKPSKHYLNITMRNMIKVFLKDTVPGSGSDSG
uniref:Homologous recombination OB-fold protein OB-fold domain-containing protein n=1 Tax=Tanacetum cinerariifolium TaxID=118510 RepID=A0A6L2N115_TANCI|nr:hypothetical protein [Tanacetum cinerariifolium]